MALVYRNGEKHLNAFVDSDYAGDTVDRNDGMKYIVANLGTLLVLRIIACLSLSVGTTLGTYIGLSVFWSVEHYHLLPISCIHWRPFSSTSCIHFEAGASDMRC
jgi:hypothetical protein